VKRRGDLTVLAGSVFAMSSSTLVLAGAVAAETPAA